MPVTVRPVESRRDLDAFIKLPFRLRADDPQWVPPLIFERRAFLDRRKNPWFEHAEAQYFLAEHDGQAVGRITAQVDERWDEFQGGSDGMFGFFDVENDPEVAAALLGTAEDWVRARGRERLLGPMDFTMHDECGLLIEGYDEPSMILEPWHPPYYRDLVEGLGLGKRIDLYMWELWFGDLKEGEQFTPMIHAAADHSRKEGVVVRHMRKREMEAEVKFQAKNLKPILDEAWAMIAEKDGEVVGAALTLPDVDQALARMKGRVLPFGWWHFLRRRRYIDRLRVFALGVLPERQHLGVAAALYERHLESAVDPGPSGGHMGWILETNKPMNRAMEGMGGRIVQRYRIYEKDLTAI